MQRLFFLFLAMIAFCALATGCAPLKPADPSMFFGNCITPPGPDPCSEDMPICQVYRDVVTQDYPSARECRAACNQASTQLSSQYFMRDCDYVVQRGCDLCEQQCLRLYPEQK
jgi:hypothetical protein